MAYMKFISIATMLICGILPCFAQEEANPPSDSLVVPSDSLIIEEINGFIVTWAKEATDEQKTVLRELINNMVKVEGGEFTMGSDGYWKGFPFRLEETPAHKETIRDFHINKYELRYLEWKVIMGEENKIGFYWVDPYWYKLNQPMVNFFYDELLDYIEKLNALTGLTFRLPYEAEWEYAAKGGKLSNGYLYSGSNNVEEVAVCSIEDYSRLLEPAEVGSKKPNELGLFDMSGNVYELVEDTYKSYDGSFEQKACCTVRGGCCGHIYHSWGLTNTSREMACDATSQYIGFRLAL